jgi:hypothetical protein
MGGETKTGSGTTLGQVLDDEEEVEVDLSSDVGEIGDAGTVGGEPVRWTAPAGAASETDSGDGRTAASRRVPPVPATPPRSRGWRTAAIVGLIIAGLLSAAIVLLWGEADNARSDAKDARALVVNAADASARVQVLEGTVTDLGKQVAALKAASDALQVSVGGAAPTADVDAKVTALTARADQLAACVNAYMDAVGAWSQNPTASTFVYRLC